MNKFDELELVSDDGVRLVSAVLGMSVYTEASLTSVAKGVLSLYEEFLTLVGRDKLRYYASETMRSHKPINKSTYTMLPTWMKPDAPQREYVSLQLKDGEQHQDEPRLKFEVHGFEAKNKLYQTGRANVLSAAFPASLELGELHRLKEFFVQACTLLPVRSGIAGLALECSRYESEISETHAWATGMRMRGLDICRIPLDCQAVGLNGLKGVGWLTALGKPLVAELGGVAQIRKGWPKDVIVIETPHAVVIQLGEEPLLGNVNRTDTLMLYRAVYKKVAPLIQNAAQRTKAFDIEEDYVEKTRQWYTRLGNE